MLDAGCTPDGMPYLVMEYVDGVPLDAYAASSPFDVKGRFALFASICDAVAYAHRNLIVHRDLKPRNILIDAHGNPKLLDFGIAKLLSETSDAEATSAAMMTRRYASPEQLAGGPITTASDVYSLGVILREFMAPAQLNPDFETVFAMALREEPDRRYASAVDFADDARRAIEGYPVRARRDTLAYRARRFIARRKWEVAIATGLAVALCASGVVALVQYRDSQRRFAEVRALANSFLFDVYDAIADQPGTEEARMLLARRAEQYLDTLARDKPSDPALRKELATAYEKLADILGAPFTPNLGDTTSALANYRKAAGLLEAIAASGPADAGVLRDWARICAIEGQIASRHGAIDDAVAAGRQSVALMERAVAIKSSGEARSALLNERLFLALAYLRLGETRNDVAIIRAGESLASAALDAARSLSAKEPANEQFYLLVQKACEYLGYIEASLARETGDRGFWELAVRDHREQAEIIQRLAATHPERYRRHVADAAGDLSRALLGAGNAAAAETVARESLVGFEAIAAADARNAEAARDVMVAHWNMGNALAARSRGNEASAEFEQVIARFEAVRRQNPAERGDIVIVESRDQLAAYKLASGDRKAALALFSRNVEMLSDSSQASDQIALALDLGRIGDALANSDPARASVTYQRAALLWQSLRDTGRLPAAYFGKPAQLQRAMSGIANVDRARSGAR